MKKPKNYGLPYMGSKNSIADWVVEHLPGGDVLVDIFAGGCAITHAAMVHNRFKHYIVNDISDAPALFIAAANGEYSHEDRWISREEFARLKDGDPYVRYVWSFGNRGCEYLYSQEVERWKHALHCAVVWHDLSGLRAFGLNPAGDVQQWVRTHHDECKDKYAAWYIANVMYSDEDYQRLKANLQSEIAKNSEELRNYLLQGLASSGLTQAEVCRRLGNQMSAHYFGRSQWEFPTRENYERMQTFMPALTVPYMEIYGLQELLQRLQSLQSLQRLQSLQSLQRLQRLQSLQSLQRLQLSYDQVPLGEIAARYGDRVVVYADPPYKGTCEYVDSGFDHERFYDWCQRCRYPLLISEYDMPSDRFKCVAEKPKRALLAGKGGNGWTTERLFRPIAQAAQNDYLPLLF